MKKIAVKLLSVFAASALLLSGCASNNGNNGDTGQNGDNKSEKPSGGISENTAAENQGQAGNAEKTESSEQGGADNSTLPLSITVNGRSYMPDSDGSGIAYASANGAIYVVFGGMNGNEAVMLTVSMADTLASKGSRVTQANFGQNAVVETIIINTDDQTISAGTTIDSTTDSYIENAVFEIKEYSSDNRQLQITLSGDYHGGGTSYSFNASGTAAYNAELEQQLISGSQVGGNGDSNTCYLCKGNGVCYYCNGRGIVYTLQGQMTCVSCNGSTLCKRCHGRGTL